jgi:hypothetical protein
MPITQVTAPNSPISHGVYHDQSRINSEGAFTRPEPMIGMGLADLKEDWLGFDSELGALEYDLLAKDAWGGVGNLSETGHGNVHVRTRLQLSEELNKRMISMEPTKSMSTLLLHLFTKLFVPFFPCPLSVFVKVDR